MGAGFTRRYNYAPGTNVITLIEGIIILDLPPPGQIAGIPSGVVALVGEFADATYGVNVDVNGVVTQSPNPVQVFSAQDMQNKVGGFDPTIGDFGNSMGNGFVELRNKQFAQLVLVPVPLVASRGIRMWRKLPFNAGPTTPSPFVPMQAATVPAATPFMSGTNQVNTAKGVTFTGNLPYAYGVDGSVTASSGATETFNALSGNFVNAGVQVGDLLVLGAPITQAVVGNPSGGAGPGAGDTTLYAAPGVTGYPSAGVLQIDSELILYSTLTAIATGASGYAFGGLTRGANGTQAAAHALGAEIVGMNNVDTYRISAVTNATSLSLQQQSGASFGASNSFSATAMPWRIHTSSDAESAAGIISNAGTYEIPARPLSASIPTGSLLAPQTPPPAQTYQSWNPLSGLTALTDPNVGLIYQAAVHAPNAPSSASIDALYQAACAALVGDDLPESTVNIVWAARKSAAIRTALRESADGESSVGVGRVAILSPDLQSVTSTSQAIASADPGVGGNRDERVFYSWPPVQTSVPEAVNINIKGADGKMYQNGMIDVTADGWLAAVCSNINPEWNPGQASAPVPQVLAPVAGLARNITTKLEMPDYIALKQAGVCAIRMDRTVGPVFQSGVTTSLVPGEQPIQRRRFADFVEDSIADATATLAKQPATLLWQDNVYTEIDAFLETLKSPTNPALQRINDYYIDPKSGNTAELNDLGVFVWIVGVKMTPTADYMVFQFNIGNGVVIPTQTA